MSVNARLKAIADEIRTLSGQTDVLSLDEMAENLKAIPKEGAKTITPSKETQIAVEGGTYFTGDLTVAPIPSEYVSTTDATATAGDILSGKTAYVNGAKVTGNIATKTASNLSASGKTVTVPAGYYASQATKDVATATQATPSISVNSSGLITASATQTAGYVSAGTKSGTKQLTTQAAQTITPGTADTTIASGTYLTGTQTIKGDANLKAENIKSGVSIFGVAGSFEGGGSGGEGVETCTLNYADWDAQTKLYYIALSNGQLTKKELSLTGTGAVTDIVKNGMLIFDHNGGIPSYTRSAGLTRFFWSGYTEAFTISYDAEIATYNDGGI